MTHPLISVRNVSGLTVKKWCSNYLNVFEDMKITQYIREWRWQDQLPLWKKKKWNRLKICLVMSSRKVTAKVLALYQCDASLEVSLCLSSSILMPHVPPVSTSHPGSTAAAAPLAFVINGRAVTLPPCVCVCVQWEFILTQRHILKPGSTKKKCALQRTCSNMVWRKNNPVSLKRPLLLILFAVYLKETPSEK